MFCWSEGCFCEQAYDLWLAAFKLKTHFSREGVRMYRVLLTTVHGGRNLPVAHYLPIVPSNIIERFLWIHRRPMTHCELFAVTSRESRLTRNTDDDIFDYSNGRNPYHACLRAPQGPRHGLRGFVAPHACYIASSHITRSLPIA